MTESEVVRSHVNEILHPTKAVSVETVAKGIHGHIRKQKLPTLLMENLAVVMANKTILKLYEDEK